MALVPLVQLRHYYVHRIKGATCSSVCNCRRRHSNAASSSSSSADSTNATLALPQLPVAFKGGTSHYAVPLCRVPASATIGMAALRRLNLATLMAVVPRAPNSVAGPSSATLLMASLLMTPPLALAVMY